MCVLPYSEQFFSIRQRHSLMDWTTPFNQGEQKFYQKALFNKRDHVIKTDVVKTASSLDAEANARTFHLPSLDGEEALYLRSADAKVADLLESMWK